MITKGNYSPDLAEARLVGRVFDLAQPLQLGFQSWEQVREYKDAEYVLSVFFPMDFLYSRFESFQAILTLLEQDFTSEQVQALKTSRHQWLNLIRDSFLMRYSSIFDCTLILSNSVCELNLSYEKCTLYHLRRSGLPDDLIAQLEAFHGQIKRIVSERNERFHRGWEKTVSQQEQIFKIASSFEVSGNSLVGSDEHGHPINLESMFSEAITEFSAEAFTALRELQEVAVTTLDILEPYFESKFLDYFRDSKPLPW